MDIWKYRHLSSLSLSPDAAGPEEAATLTLAPEPERGGREENLGELPTSLTAQSLLAENIKMV